MLSLKPHLHDTTCCQTGLTTSWTTGCIVYTNIQPVVKPVVQPDWQRVVQPFVRPVQQPVVSCKTGYNRSHWMKVILKLQGQPYAVQPKFNSVQLHIQCTEWNPDQHNELMHGRVIFITLPGKPAIYRPSWPKLLADHKRIVYILYLWQVWVCWL